MIPVNLFYTPNINTPTTTLPEEESKHIVRVLRKKEGDKVFFTDGLGFIYNCIIIEANPKRCIVEIIEKNIGEDKRDFKLHIAIAPTKNITRFEWFLEKATEIGIDHLTPIICYHSERKNVKIDRLNKVITSAMKQSLKSSHPKLHNAVTFKELITTPFDGEKFIAYIDDEVTTELGQIYKPHKDILILIGPEGDFSKQEFDEALNVGFVPVRLGKARLRTETAGIVACHTINLVNTLKQARTSQI